MRKSIAKGKNIRKERRSKRVRSKVGGTASRPRLSVFRSLSHVYASLIDDEKGRTLATTSDLKDSKKKMTKTMRAGEVGKAIAEKAKGLGIKIVVFDRGGRKYHGRVKAVAEGAREGGLKF